MSLQRFSTRDGQKAAAGPTGRVRLDRLWLAAGGLLFDFVLVCISMALRVGARRRRERPKRGIAAQRV